MTDLAITTLNKRQVRECIRRNKNPEVYPTCASTFYRFACSRLRKRTLIRLEKMAGERKIHGNAVCDFLHRTLFYIKTARGTLKYEEESDDETDDVTVDAHIQTDDLETEDLSMDTSSSTDPSLPLSSPSFSILHSLSRSRMAAEVAVQTENMEAKDEGIQTEIGDSSSNEIQKGHASTTRPPHESSPLLSSSSSSSLFRSSAFHPVASIPPPSLLTGPLTLSSTQSSPVYSPVPPVQPLVATSTPATPQSAVPSAALSAPLIQSHPLQVSHQVAPVLAPSELQSPSLSSPLMQPLVANRQVQIPNVTHSAVYAPAVSAPLIQPLSTPTNTVPTSAFTPPTVFSPALSSPLIQSHPLQAFHQFAPALTQPAVSQARREAPVIPTASLINLLQIPATNPFGPSAFFANPAIPSNAPPVKCPFCEQNHQPIACYHFGTSEDREKIRLLKGLCTFCLNPFSHQQCIKPGHIYNCPRCNGLHHSALCPSYFPSRNV